MRKVPRTAENRRLLEAMVADALTGDDVDLLIDQGRRDLVGCCLAYLRNHREGEDHYLRSLAPAAAWGNTVVHGGAPDRRYGVAVAEADLHRAMMALPIMLLTVAQLSRTDPQLPGWARKWDQRLGLVCRHDWWNHRDAALGNNQTATWAIQVARIIGRLIRDAADHMADTLGPSWLNP